MFTLGLAIFYLATTLYPVIGQALKSGSKAEMEGMMSQPDSSVTAINGLTTIAPNLALSSG